MNRATLEQSSHSFSKLRADLKGAPSARPLAPPFTFQGGLALSSLLAVSVYSSAFACGDVNGLPDYNCDGAVTVAVVGDSLVYGVGDTVNGGQGGYVTRVQKRFPMVNFVNLGEQGLHASTLLRRVIPAFKGTNYTELRDALLPADIIVLDVGRNDRWEFGPASNTYRQLKKIAETISNGVEQTVGTAPLMIQAVLMLPNRGAQGPWVKELDEYILKGSTSEVPADLRFDLVSKRLLSSDQVHPTSKGYTALAQTFTAYLKKKLPKLARMLHPDQDKDGIPDVFEAKFQTNPLLSDTDGDSVSDQEEIFIQGTDPLVAEVTAY